MIPGAALLALVVLLAPGPGRPLPPDSAPAVPGVGRCERCDDPRMHRDLDALTAEVASQLRCPVCRQLSILDSPSELAQEMRALIRERLAAGETPEEVKAYFVSKYGEWILLEPPKRGFNLLVWVLPVLGTLGGAALLGVGLWRWTRAPGPPGGDGGDGTGPDGPAPVAGTGGPHS